MARSALTLRGLVQELPGAALDVYAETHRQDAGLTQFHKSAANSVRVLSAAAEVPWDQIAPWSILCASQGFDNSDRRLGGAEEGLVLSSVFVWPEPDLFRDPGETGGADLDLLYRLAIQGGRNAAGTLVTGNAGLAWRDAWGAVPSGFASTSEAQTASAGILRGPLATRHGAVEGSLSDGQPCIIHAQEFQTVFGITRSRC